MKRRLTLIAFIMISFTKVNAQNSNEFLKQKETQIKYLVQQIAALQVYVGYVKKGYQVAQQGLSLYEKIKDGNFNLHKDYIQALNQVNPNISNDGKTKAMTEYLERAIEDFRIFNQKSQKDENFTPEEKKYLLHIYRTLAENCKESKEELELVISSENIKMTDDKRLKKINMLYNDALIKWAFVQSFIKNSQRLSLQRDKEMREVNELKTIHGLQIK